MSGYMERIDSPKDLKAMSREELKELAREQIAQDILGALCDSAE